MGFAACRVSQREWQELDYGPNGGLVYAMEYLSENMSWLEASWNPRNPGKLV